MVGHRGPGHSHRLLDLSGRDLALGAHEDEEHLEAAEVGEGLERLDVDVLGFELGQREARGCFHRFYNSKFSNQYQAEIPRRRRQQRPLVTLAPPLRR
jgi:hypothetical protein